MKKTIKIISYILVFVAFIAILYFIGKKTNWFTEAFSDIAVFYENKELANNSSLALPCDKELTFKVEAKDFSVIIKPGVDEVHDFDFKVNDEVYSFNAEKDLSAAFDIKIEDNLVILNLDSNLTMSDILSAIYTDCEISVPEEVKVNEYDCFCLSIFNDASEVNIYFHLDREDTEEEINITTEFVFTPIDSKLSIVDEGSSEHVGYMVGTGGDEYNNAFITGEGTKAVIPNKYNGKPVLTIGCFAFAKSKFTSILVPESVLKIDEAAFLSAEAETIEILAESTTIGQRAFSHCKNLKTVYLPDNLKSISFGLFDSCESLVNINLQNITSIASYAFYNCESLYLTIPATITSTAIGSTIGTYAFYNVFTVYFKSLTPPTLDVSVLGGDGKWFGKETKIYVEKGALNNYKEANGWDLYATQIEAVSLWKNFLYF